MDLLHTEVKKKTKPNHSFTEKKNTVWAKNYSFFDFQDEK